MKQTERPYYTPSEMDEMTDLELVDYYIDTCLRFIDPRTFRKIQERGLYGIINRLDGPDAKKVARARMAQTGRYTGNPDIEIMAGLVDRIKTLQKELSGINPADADQVESKVEQIVNMANALLKEYN